MQREAKICPVCGIEKDCSEYHKDVKTPLQIAWACKECTRKRRRDHYYKNREKTRLHQKEYRDRMPLWVKENEKKSKLISQRKDRQNEKRKLSDRMSTAIHLSLKGERQSKHWEQLVGYTLKELKEHLENNFKKGMSWGNIGQWHIDHIIPKSAFNYKNPDHIDFKRCWALKNLQPLWAIENYIKNKRLNIPFQPTLLLEV